MGRTHASSYGSVLAPVYHNGKEPPSSDGSLSENEALQQCHRMRNISNTSRQVAHLVTQAQYSTKAPLPPWRGACLPVFGDRQGEAGERLIQCHSRLIVSQPQFAQ